MVEYITNPDDGVRSYHSDRQWLAHFILPFDTERSSGVEDFEAARVEFERRPTDFIKHIERFFELLKTRDLCKLLFSYLGINTDVKKSSDELGF